VRTGGAALLLALAGCGQPVVQVGHVPTPAPADATACGALTADLPAKVGDSLSKRTVEPKSPLIAAWGKPAVVLRCGVGTPATYRPDVDLQVVDNIGWFGDERSTDTVYTSMTRRPRVAVAVPKSQGSSFDVLVDLSAAIGRHTVVRDPGT
jgi:hypothetical protein